MATFVEVINGLKLDSPIEGVIQREAFVVPESWKMK